MCVCVCICVNVFDLCVCVHVCGGGCVCKLIWRDDVHWVAPGRKVYKWLSLLLLLLLWELVFAVQTDAFAQLIWMNYNMLPQSAGLWKLMLISFHTMNIHGREVDFGDVIWCSFNVLLGLDFGGLEPFSFRFGIPVRTTTFFILIAAWMTLTFTQCHRVIRKL